MKPRLMLLFALLVSGYARADLYGYVDAQGQAHLANYPVDERYQLFQRGSSPTPEPAERSAVLADATTPGLGATLSSDSRPPEPVSVSEASPAPFDPQLAARFSRLISRTAREFGLDVQLLHSIVTVESAYNPLAISPKGAIGLMQVMPATGKRFGITALTDPRQNLLAGARYLHFLLERFNHDLPLVIAAYNAGEGAVQKYRNTIPPFRETRDYVAKVLASYQQRKGGESGTRVRAVFTPDAAGL
ncbi:lytic transglycosylase domain-containing protein [Pseudogulbenkiania sp. NH8B]|uniref:lytic transglycosylase domain-containing protein n=1 Tax=Pseudogulbenkiania sp. (strain NH8B) TaxID=748280 RepID=UPI00059F04AD|nr:lytic transglycosylase domain-containing protein [Pseudogulbenkiania sp. NH8B]